MGATPSPPYLYLHHREPQGESRLLAVWVGASVRRKLGLPLCFVLPRTPFSRTSENNPSTHFAE
jgi:hypothetical protein